MLAKFLESARKETGLMICFPKWSQLVFMYDLEHYPVKSLSDTYLLLTNPPYSYLAFFEKTRGYPRPLHGKERIWQTFQQGSLLLYFDQLFFRMLKEPEDTDDRLLEFLDILGKHPVPQWDYLVQGFGACCIEFFLRTPELYCRVNRDSTDHVLLGKLGKKLQYERLPDEISRYDSRPTIIQKLSTRVQTPTE